MTEEIKAWITKADKDFRSARHEMALASDANLDLVCFLCQQAAEKWPKAVLTWLSIVPPKTHDLVELSRQIHAKGIELPFDEVDFRWLSQGAVIYRYPGDSATLQEASRAVTLVGDLRHHLMTVIYPPQS